MDDRKPEKTDPLPALKPYAAPAIVFEHPTEVLAGVCDGTSNCPSKQASTGVCDTIEACTSHNS